MQTSADVQSASGEAADAAPGLLGQIVQNCCDFARSQYDESTEVFDRVNGRRLPAKEYFRDLDWAWVVKRDHLPYDLNVKGVLIRDDGVLRVELTGVDFVKTVDRMRQQRDLGRLELKGRRFFLDGQPLVRTMTENVVRDGPPRYRTLVASLERLPTIGRERTRFLIRLFDLLYDFHCFREDSIITPEEEPAIGSAPAIGIEMRLEQRMAMAMLLKQEQVMQLEPGPYPQTQLAKTVVALGPQKVGEVLSQLGMSECQLDAVIGKTLWTWAVRKIQRVKPGLSFQEAAAICKRLTSKRRTKG